MRLPTGGAVRFKRVHLMALLYDWRRTILAVVGVALGVTLVLGMAQLRNEVVKPFDSFGPALTQAAKGRVIQVTPQVSGRLPEALVARLQHELPDVQAVVPFVAGLTPVEIRGERHGFFVMGAPCEIELLVGPFQCAERARTERPADGPGTPFEIPKAVADRLALTLGDEVRLPGRLPGSAHLGWTFPEYERVQSINGGNVLLAPSAAHAADLLGGKGFVTAAFVIEKPGADVEADIQQIVGDIATTGPPKPQMPVLYATAKQTLDLTAFSGILIGILIAVNTILLGIEERRSVMGTIGAIGAKPRSTFFGFLGEGAILGAAGGLVAVPSGFLLGSFLVDRFGRSMLAGSGGEISNTWSPSLIALGVGAGVLCGVLAIFWPALRLVREGPLQSMSAFGADRRVRRVSFLPLIIGAILIFGAVLLMLAFNRGQVPLKVGSNGLFLGLLGLTALMVWLTPPAAGLLIRLIERPRPDIGRLVRADVQRYAVLFATTVAVLTVGTSLAIGSQSVQLLAADQLGAQKAQRLPDALVIAPQALLDQRQTQIAPDAYEAIREAAGRREIDSRWRALIPSASDPRVVLGVTPGSWYAAQFASPTNEAATFWRGLSAGEVALSTVAAGRLGATAGDTIELPSVAGHHKYRVTGVFEPKIINDSTLGDIVLVSAQLAQSDWAAVREQVVVRYESAAEASAHRPDFLALGAGLSLYDDDGWNDAGKSAITRFFAPFTVSGYVMMLTAGISVLNVFLLGLVQRRRERAVLRAIGTTTRREQAVVIAQGLVLAVLAAGFAVLGGLGLIYLQALASPVFYGFQLSWGITAYPLVVGTLGVAALVAAAIAYPVLHASRLETSEVLQSD